MLKSFSSVTGVLAAALIMSACEGFAPQAQTRTGDETWPSRDVSMNQIDLVEIEFLLLKIGLSAGPIDGAITRQTRQAITNFQRIRALPETGAVSPSLLNALRLTTGSGQTLIRSVPATAAATPVPRATTANLREDRFKHIRADDDDDNSSQASSSGSTRPQSSNSSAASSGGGSSLF